MLLFEFAPLFANTCFASSKTSCCFVANRASTAKEQGNIFASF